MATYLNTRRGWYSPHGCVAIAVTVPPDTCPPSVLRPLTQCIDEEAMADVETADRSEVSVTPQFVLK